MKVVGFDPGLVRIGAAGVDDRGRQWCFSWQRPRTVAANREARVEAALLGMCSVLTPERVAGARVVLEAPITGGSGNAWTAAGLAGVWGAAVLRCIELGAESLSSVPPAAWKKAVCGRGDLGKDQVRAWLSVRHPAWSELARSQDEADAACLALYGLLEVQ